MKKDFEEILKMLNEKADSFLADNEKISELIEDAKDKIENNEIFEEVASDMKESIEMLSDWKEGEYKGISQNTVALIIGVLIYIVNPLGIVPKFLNRIPLGRILAVTYLIKRIKEELEDYREWKAENKRGRGDSETVYIKL